MLTTRCLQAVCECVWLRERERGRPRSSLYSWWAGLHCMREEGASPPGNGVPRVRSASLHVSHPEPSGRSCSAASQAMSYSSESQCRLTCPRASTSSPWQDMAQSYLRHALVLMHRGRASRLVGTPGLPCGAWEVGRLVLLLLYGSSQGPLAWRNPSPYA
jgi:hypothetical protein